MASALAAAAVLGAGASGAEALTWKIKGAGFGHGIGLSQYGAYGYAKHGWGYKRIVLHYYRSTTIGKTPSRNVRVLLRPYQSSVRFTGASAACKLKLASSKTYSAVRKGGHVVLRNPKGSGLRNCGKVLSATGGASVAMVGKGSYRGALQVRPSSVPGKVNAINSVKLEDYVRGIVARESPSSWPLNALRAQAVVARSYGLANDVGGNGFDQYDDTRSQVYGGISAETSRTNKAVSTSKLQVVKYKGKIASTYFFSTSGGHTENIENVFIGSSPQPYLKGVKDPYDGSSPYHRWTARISQSGMQSALDDLVRGKLRQIKVVKRGSSPRVVRAKLIGSGGTTKVSGPTIQFRLGLRDSWMFFKKLK
ncbi:MAG: SpoIID/LytB domain-containing protein [Solirubrobacterales bacterium]|nr:SpoIID/LytB domain-containing protein [Solirubrobacterales bacterium]